MAFAVVLDANEDGYFVNGAIALFENLPAGLRRAVVGLIVFLCEPHHPRQCLNEVVRFMEV